MSLTTALSYCCPMSVLLLNLPQWTVFCFPSTSYFHPQPTLFCWLIALLRHWLQALLEIPGHGQDGPSQERWSHRWGGGNERFRHQGIHPGSWLHLPSCILFSCGFLIFLDVGFESIWLCSANSHAVLDRPANTARKASFILDHNSFQVKNHVSSCHIVPQIPGFLI